MVQDAIDEYISRESLVFYLSSVTLSNGNGKKRVKPTAFENKTPKNQTVSKQSSQYYP